MTDAPAFSLQFADSFTDTHVKLFELDELVLQELLATGGRRVAAAVLRCMPVL